MRMTENIATGALEQEVLSQLWLMNEPATPGEVLDALDSDLAYTTIMTVLTHLWQKGLVNRRRRGRAYAYSPALTEADLTAQRMQAALGAASNRKAALTGFARSLSAREARALRDLLDPSRRKD
jgi:predicted transcriptional regulator